MDTQLKNDMSAPLMYSLYEAIQRRCATSSDEKRCVSIFAYELSEIAGSSSDVIEWLKDEGRSYGVIPVFATQRAGQLNEQVRESVLGFGTILAYTQDVPNVMKQIVADLESDGSKWTSADVANLPPFEAIVHTRVGRARQAPFIVSLTNFESSMESYEHIQTAAPATAIG